jgi:hypothetical protein
MMTLALMALFVGQFDFGTTRACVYQAIGKQYIITIDAHKLCPMTIEV